MTANTNIETVNVNWVVTDTFFAVDENGKIVGIIDLRVSKQTYTRSFYKFRFIGRLSAEGKRPFSRSKTCRLRTFPHSARFSAMMQIHQRKHCFKEETVMRHVTIRGILALIWLAAAVVSGLSGNLEWAGLYVLMGAAFGYSACSAWKKRGK